MVKLLVSVFLAISFASTVFARELIAQTQVNGKPVLVFDDGFWRYDDSVGEICSQTGRHGAVCALPSEWSRLPEVDELRYGLPEFVQGEFIAEFRVLQHWGGEALSVQDALAFIGNQTLYDGLKGTVLLSASGKIGELEGGNIVMSAGQHGVFSFTFVNQDGRYLIARTRDQNSTIYHSDHRDAHQSFVDAIRPSPFEK